MNCIKCNELITKEDNNNAMNIRRDLFEQAETLGLDSLHDEELLIVSFNKHVECN